MKSTFGYFEKLDIRIGTVVKAQVPEWSHWVMRLEVDLGDEIGKRIVFAGLMKFYKPEDLVNKQYPFIVNIEPKKIGPKQKDGKYNFSQALLLAATVEVKEKDYDEKPVLFTLSQKVDNGAKVK